MNEAIKEYLNDRRVFIDDLVQELDNAKSNEEMLTITLKIKGRRSAATEIFNDLIALTNANENGNNK